MSVAESADSPVSPPAIALTLVDEISHRVLNDYMHAIAVVSMAAAGIADRKARLALAAVDSRLRAYADVHRALRPPRGAAQLDLGEYLQGLCAALAQASLHDRGVHLAYLHGQAMLDAPRCWRVGLIVSELVTNAVKHAFGAGRIEVEVRACPGVVYCRVSDDGQAETSSPSRGRGRGIVEDLALELGGQVQWRFGETGTSVLLAVPVDPSEPL